MCCSDSCRLNQYFTDVLSSFCIYFSVVDIRNEVYFTCSFCFLQPLYHIREPYCVSLCLVHFNEVVHTECNAFIEVVYCVSSVCLLVPVPQHVLHRSRTIAYSCCSTGSDTIIRRKENVVAVFHKLEALGIVLQSFWSESV